MKRLPLIVLILAVAGGLVVGSRYFGRSGELVVTTTPVVRGPLRMTVETTGTVSPLVSVNVGCEVSGTIGELNADFNSEVTKGQVLARLRPELFEAELAQANANLLSAQAQRQAALVEVQRARRQAERLSRLRDERGAAADEEVKTAEEAVAAFEARLAGAEASVKQAEAVRDLAQTKLDRAVIYAPIDGIVLDRLVDVGQTVAAAFATPVLFVLAPDLDHMQVHANVSESDIGNVRVHQSVEFTVDTYPDIRFKGIVSQVRNQPSTIQHVVSYTVVIDVDNRQLLLKPGMTANIVIEVALRENTLKITNAALRFRPPITPEQLSDLTESLQWPEAVGVSSSAVADSEGDLAQQPSGAAYTPRGRTVLWVYENDHWSPKPVILGITDHRETEILAGVSEGMPCVTNARQKSGGGGLKEALKLASPENRSL
jgi:HlyD family secretion protein